MERVRNDMKRPFSYNYLVVDFPYLIIHLPTGGLQGCPYCSIRYNMFKKYPIRVLSLFDCLSPALQELVKSAVEAALRTELASQAETRHDGRESPATWLGDHSCQMVCSGFN